MIRPEAARDLLETKPAAERSAAGLFASLVRLIVAAR
jgi:hypothetical protein